MPMKQKEFMRDSLILIGLSYFAHSEFVSCLSGALNLIGVNASEVIRWADIILVSFFAGGSIFTFIINKNRRTQRKKWAVK